MDDWESARRLLREYGKEAEAECDARAAYHQMQGDMEAADQWRGLKKKLLILRAGGPEN